MNAFFVMEILLWKKQLLLVMQQRKQKVMLKSLKNTKNQLMYTKSIVQRTTNRDVLTRNPNNPTIPSTSVNSVAAPTNEENVLHMVKDAISATAKTTLKPVVPRRKLTVLLKRTTPFLALAPVQSPTILPQIPLPRQDLRQVKQVCLQLTTLNQTGRLHSK